MPHGYTEDSLVERPAVLLFAELGWETASGEGEVFGAAGTFGRASDREAVLTGRVRTALERLNPRVPATALEAAIDALTQDRSAMSLVGANREVYGLLKEGILVSVPDRERGGQKEIRLRLIDWDEPANNDLLLVSQLTIAGRLYNCRPDLIGFVNGLPWVVVEFKKPGVAARIAFDENLTHYKAQIPSLFWSNAVLIASNGVDSRIGSLTADWERFFEWKRIAREDEPRRVSLEVMLRGTCDPARLLDLVENFTLFSEHKEGLVKILGQNHQVLGVNNAITAMLDARARGDGRAGVFWQTQGSGKSFSMVFFAQKVLRRIIGNWSFVVVTDRVELDDQIAKTFKAVGAVSEEESKTCHATSGAQLRELLRGDNRYVFTLIHKFQTPELLADRPDIIVLTDEAHRSQYDTLALNMRSALPRALFLAFTGTPLIAGEERTKDIFGNYVSIYDFQQSVEDGATVPLYYENRTPELRLVNPNLNDDLYAVIESAELDPDQEARLERELERSYHLITRDDRLDTVARDIVRHFLGRGFVGKAMVVSIDKATALRMHDKVKAYWAADFGATRAELSRLAHLPPDERETPTNVARTLELRARLDVLETTDMALIVSPGQNEIAQMAKLGLDIAPHRKRMIDEELDEMFKDSVDPLCLVFVCAMWLTGFDAPSCSTIYLDKPMRNHTLMQTIARANRVYPGKHAGVIVDYANVFASLEQALAIYGAGKGGVTPVQDKSELGQAVRNALEAATLFCASQGVSLAAIEATTAMARLKALGDAVNALISPDETRRDFLSHARLVGILYRAVLPEPTAREFSERVHLLDSLAAQIRTQLNPEGIDISGVMEGIGKILDVSIAGHAIRDDGPKPLDLSQINFEELSKRFKGSRQRNTDLERLKAIIRAQLDRMISLNPTRANFRDTFEALIEEYNRGSRNIDELLDELLKLSRSLDEEQQRHLRENLSEEELVIFDILTRPAPDLTTAERNEVKKVARELLERLRGLLVVDWRVKVSGRAAVQEAIGEGLDQGLPEAYDTGYYEAKCAAVFEYVYTSAAIDNPR